MISREVIDEIIRRNDIESLIGSYISLKRAGSNLKGLCPFHGEKTPSFTVYPADNSFYCFGCGVGGNAITFIRQMEHLDYPDAMLEFCLNNGYTCIDLNKLTINLYNKLGEEASKKFHMIFNKGIYKNSDFRKSTCRRADLCRGKYYRLYRIGRRIL